jgi:ATP-dependent helicase Lhr and Lhr-like helicase
MKKENNYSQDLAIADKLGRVWDSFFTQHGKLLPIQRQAIPHILDGEDVIVIAPTASGKTEAVVAPITKRLIDSGWKKPSILYISPTRSLINDLYERLSPRLNQLGLLCGRRTGEYRQTDVDLLLTTPESFDSMMVRGWVRNTQNKVTGHLFQNIRVVVLDEIHLLQGNVRGEQLAWLLARLRRLLLAVQNLKNKQGLQICGLSATVADPQNIRRKYLGRSAKILDDESGHRNWSLLNFNKGVEEIIVKKSDSREKIHDHITLLSGNDKLQAKVIAKHIRSLYALRDISGQRLYKKILIFVGSRKKCDRLSANLSHEDLGPATGTVFAHHGSLSKAEREKTEKALRMQPGALCVSTMTLELGIDIGDIDLIVLLEPPLDVQSLMQRIGRGCRRSNKINIWPIALSPIQRILFSGLIKDGVASNLSSAPNPKLISVFLQQITSYIKQSTRHFRSLQNIVNLSLDITHNPLAENDFTEFVIDCLDEGVLAYKVAHLNHIQLGSKLSDWTADGAFLHSNISSDITATVVDHWTGDEIAHVSGIDGHQFKLAGKLYNVQKEDAGKISVVSTKKETSPGEVSYQAKRLPVTFSFTQQVLKYFELPEYACVILDNGFVAHFGGDFIALFLRQLARPRLTSNAWIASAECQEIFIENWSLAELEEAVSKNWEAFKGCLSLGSYFNSLPFKWQKKAVIMALDLDWWADWLSDRQLLEVNSIKKAEIVRLLL